MHRLALCCAKSLRAKAPWIIALASFCIGSVRHVVDGWYPRYISSMFDVGPRELFSFAPYQMASVAMPFAAVVGGLVAGNASDRLFQSRRAPVIFSRFSGWRSAC